MESGELLIKKNGKANIKESIGFFALLFVFGGIYGFLYELIDCRIDMGVFVNKGSTFGQWIPIYAFGGVFIYIFSNRFRAKPWLVFIIDCLVTGTLEYVTGYILLHRFGTRLWDYTYVHWNFGNIDGIICARSVLFFGFSGLILVYLLAPFIKRLLSGKAAGTVTVIGFILFALFIADIIAYQILS